jgi:hypothetical protein
MPDLASCPHCGTKLTNTPSGKRATWIGIGVAVVGGFIALIIRLVKGNGTREPARVIKRKRRPKPVTSRRRSEDSDDL